MYSRSHISYEECWHIFNQPIYDFVGEAVILLLYIYTTLGGKLCCIEISHLPELQVQNIK